MVESEWVYFCDPTTSECLRSDGFCRDSSADWSQSARQVIFMLKDELSGVFLYVAFNTSHEPVSIRLPTRGRWAQPDGERDPLVWMRVVDTARQSPTDILEDEALEPHITENVCVEAYSAVLFRAALQAY